MATSKANVKAKATAPSRIPQYTPIITTTTPILPQRSQQIPVNNADLRPFFSRMTTTLRQSFAQRRPWFELIDRSNFSRPESLSEAASRVRKNLSYFRVNYTAILAVVVALSLLSHPISLFFFVGLVWSWLFLYLFRSPDQPVFLYDRNFSDRDTLGILIISTILVVFLTGLGSLMMYSSLVGLGFICVHGAFRVPQEVFAEDQEPDALAGLISFINITAAAAGVAAPTIPRV
ncbi:hypothetical protein L2E82_22296 [Cichorium intybus]|uniref:Uncharacterized protein n=1 Tax=Cichorium intybus TaxID=13427 RepID=A0ACB9DY40_CICIN|nr:hypothetical protein L1887_23463 [Cichorium endivia]KAI3751248.1 hypothetical protein L2E82_22296 [Cichorium intybus]